MVAAHKVKTANVWLVQAKYLQTTLKSTKTIPKTQRNNGKAIIKRLLIARCSIFKKSATINLAERNAVSPDVIGAAITPMMANIPPTVPNHERLTLSITNAAIFSPGCCAAKALSPSIPYSPCSGSAKNVPAAAAHISARIPSATIAP